MLMGKMRTASSREEVLNWQKKLEDEQREMRRELRAANAMRWEGIVEWPGGRGEPRSVGIDVDEAKLVRTSSGMSGERGRAGESRRKERSRDEKSVNGVKKGKRHSRLKDAGVDAA
jgi:hypothetical protein